MLRNLHYQKSTVRTPKITAQNMKTGRDKKDRFGDTIYNKNQRHEKKLDVSMASCHHYQKIRLLTRDSWK